MRRMGGTHDATGSPTSLLFKGADLGGCFGAGLWMGEKGKVISNLRATTGESREVPCAALREVEDESARTSAMMSTTMGGSLCTSARTRLISPLLAVNASTNF